MIDLLKSNIHTQLPTQYQGLSYIRELMDTYIESVIEHIYSLNRRVESGHIIERIIRSNMLPNLPDERYSTLLSDNAVEVAKEFNLGSPTNYPRVLSGKTILGHFNNEIIYLDNKIPEIKPWYSYRPIRILDHSDTHLNALYLLENIPDSPYACISINYPELILMYNGWVKWVSSLELDYTPNIGNFIYTRLLSGTVHDYINISWKNRINSYWVNSPIEEYKSPGKFGTIKIDRYIDHLIDRVTDRLLNKAQNISGIISDIPSITSDSTLFESLQYPSYIPISTSQASSILFGTTLLNLFLQIDDYHGGGYNLTLRRELKRLLRREKNGRWLSNVKGLNLVPEITMSIDELKTYVM